MPRRLDRPGLMGGDVAGFRADHALPRAQRRRDHDGVRLRPADEEVDVGLRRGAGVPDQGAGALAAGVGAVAGVLLQVGGGEGLQDLRMAALGVVGIKTDHLIYSFESAT